MTTIDFPSKFQGFGMEYHPFIGTISPSVLLCIVQISSHQLIAKSTKNNLVFITYKYYIQYGKSK